MRGNREHGMLARALDIYRTQDIGGVVSPLGSEK